MTTVAYHHGDKEIAVDSRTSRGDLIMTDEGVKYSKVNGVTFVLCGSVCDEKLFKDYYFSKQETKTLPECSGFVIDNGVCYLTTINNNGCVDKTQMSCSDAIGSGGDFAIAAMDFGCSAREAVKYASTRDPFTGGKIKVIKVK